MDTMRKGKHPIHKFHIFIAVIFITKIVLMGLFSSDYQNAMFMRFINGFLEQIRSGNWINPYEYFKLEPELFPYPPVMLAVECIGGVLSGLAGESIFLQNLLFKLPSLFFDCLGMHYLMVMFPRKRRYVAFLYFASPIIIYSTYMHGQLDIIPTTLLLGAISYLTNSRQNKAGKYMLFLFLALTCKFHIFAVLPILLIYIAKREGWKEATIKTAIPVAAVVLCVIPFWGEGFRQNVLFNSEQSVLTKITMDYLDIKIYIPILALALLYMKTFTISRLNKDLLYSLCGILFAVFLVLIPPMPGWYVWIVPFITIYFIDMTTDRYYDVVIFAALNGLYLLYFLIAHQTGYVDLYFLEKSLIGIKSTSPHVINGLFTLMTAVLVYCIYMMYQSGVASNSFYKRRNMPFAIGIAGDSGSGKSTFTSLINQIFGEKKVLIIEGDGDHRWERGNTMWEQFSHLNPKSNYLYRQARDLSQLKNNESVLRIEYDHDTGKFTAEHRIRPKPILLLCGLHALYLPQVRNNLDLKIYMDVDETLRRFWKIQRDTAKRGYDINAILAQITGRTGDAEKYIYPQKQYADVIFSYFDHGLADCMDQEHTVKLSLKATIDLAVDLEPLIQRLTRHGISVLYDYDESLTKQSITVEGENLESRRLPIAEIAYETIPHLDELISQPLQVDDDLHGIMAIVLLMMVGQKLKEG